MEEGRDIRLGIVGGEPRGGDGGSPTPGGDPRRLAAPGYGSPLTEISGTNGLMSLTDTNPPAIHLLPRRRFPSAVAPADPVAPLCV